MSSNTRIVRISISLDEYLEDMARQLSVQLNRPVSKTEASHVLATARIVKRRRRKREDVLGSFLHI